MFDDAYQNTVELGSVAVFDNVECSKAQAMKVLEEAAEVFGAWQKLDKDAFSDSTDLIGELCDVIQACCNMAAAIGCDDLRLALWDCEVSQPQARAHNRHGRSGEPAHAREVQTFRFRAHRGRPEAQRLMGGDRAR